MDTELGEILVGMGLRDVAEGDTGMDMARPENQVCTSSCSSVMKQTLNSTMDSSSLGDPSILGKGILSPGRLCNVYHHIIVKVLMNF